MIVLQIVLQHTHIADLGGVRAGISDYGNSNLGSVRIYLSDYTSWTDKSTGREVEFLEGKDISGEEQRT